MPNVRQYMPDVSPIGPTGRADATAADFGGAVNQGIEAAGSALLGGSEQLHEYNVKVDTYKAELAAAQEREDAYSYLSSAKTDPSNMQNGAQGFAQKMAEAFKQRGDDLADKYQDLSPQALAQLQIRNQQTYSRYMRDAHAYEAHSTANFMTNQLERQLDTNSNIVEANPQMYQAMKESTSNLIQQNPYWDNPDQKAAFQKQKTSELADSFLRGTVGQLATNQAATPGMIQHAINKFGDPSGEWASTASRQGFSSAIEKLNQLKEEKTKQQMSFLQKNSSDSIASLSATGTYAGQGGPNDMLSDAAIKRNFPDPVAQAKMFEQRNTAQAMGNENNKIKDPRTSFGDYSKEIDDFQSNIGTMPNYKDNEKILNTKIDVFKDNIKQFKEDSAGYVMDYPQVQALYKQYQQNPNPITARQYADASISAQQAKMPGVIPHVLTKDQIGSYAQQMKAVGTNPGGADDAYDMLQKIQQEWGPNARYVMRDLATGKAPAINPTQYVAATMVDDPVNKTFAQDLLRASLFKQEELAKNTGKKGAETNANTDAVNALAPLTRTLQNQVGGDQMSDNFRSALVQYTLYKGAFAGADIDSLPQRAAQQMVMGKYSFTDSYRVPVNENPSAVKRGAETITGNFNDKDIILPQSLTGQDVAARRAKYVANLNASARLITNGDESGLRVVDAEGKPVYRNSDNGVVPLQYSWNDLRTMGAKSSWNKAIPQTKNNPLNPQPMGIGDLKEREASGNTNP